MIRSARLLFLALLPLLFALQGTASEYKVTGAYICYGGGIYTLRLAILDNGNYLARWDGDIGFNGSASGSWKRDGDKVILTPKKEELMMKGYLTIMCFKTIDGKPALLRIQDSAYANNPLFYFYRNEKSGEAP